MILADTASGGAGRLRLTAVCLCLALTALAAPLAARDAELIGPAGKCLGIRGTPAERAPVALETCAGNAADQRWQLPSPGFDGPIVGAGGLCLDVANAASDDHAAIQVFACHGGANQRWRLQDDGKLVGLAGKCLDIEGGGTADGTPAVLFGCHGGDNQRFLALARNAWSRLPLPGKLAISGEIFAGDDGRIVYLDSFADDGLLRSADGGSSWSVVPAEHGWNRDRTLKLVDRTDPDRLFAVAPEGLMFSQDGGRSWVVGVERGQLVRQSPAFSDHFFAASSEAIFRSVDRGATFQRLASLPADGLLSTALAIARDGDLYLSRHGRCPDTSTPCGTEAKLYRSRDLGATWVLLRSAAFFPGEQLLAHPTAAGTLYWLHDQGTGLQTVLGRSDDDGATWTSVATPLGIGTSAVIDPAAPDDLWLIAYGALLHSRDRGASWQTETFHGNPQWSAGSLALAAGRLVVLAFKNGLPDPEDEPALLAVREEAGWVALPFPRIGVQSMFFTAAAARPGRFFASRFDVWRTDDSGRTWTQVQERACPGSIAADPVLPDTLYLGASECDLEAQRAVVYRSTDGGATLAPAGPVRRASTLQIRAFPWQGGTAVVALSQEPSDGAPAVAVRSFDRFQTWSTVELPGAATDLFVARIANGNGNGDSVLLASAAAGSSIHRSFDAGQTWDTIEVPGRGFTAGAGLLLTSSFGTLHLSRDAGATWRTISAPFAWGSTIAARIDPQGRILLFAQDGRLLASADEGRTWQWLALDQPDAFVFYLAPAFDPFDARRFLIGTSQGPYLVDAAPATATPAPPLALSERFEARLTWRDGAGGSGAGHGKRLTDHTGLFSLFTPEREEVAVKLLDARAINGRFWVFVASLTHVELDLEIHDRLTGDRRTYHNALGQLASFGDTAAFPLGSATPSVAPQPARVAVATPVSEMVTAGGRFTVEVAWTDPLGQSGAGSGFPLSHDTAAFYFFDRSNIELLVNVIDGRPLNGRFWVFFGSLSNVGYTVTITDTATGQQRVYENPAGTFASFGDTSAF